MFSFLNARNPNVIAVDGWAFKPNEKELEEKNIKIYEKFVKEKRKYIFDYERHFGGYNTNIYSGELVDNAPDIDVSELLIWLDEGNLCFGGQGIIRNETDSFSGKKIKKFYCYIYTD